jgi:hypothetical protein
VPHNLGHNIGSLHNSPQTRDGYTELNWRGAAVDVVDIEGAPWRPSVESLVRSEADFRFRCVTSSGRTSVGSLVRSEADSHFWLDDEGVGEKANHTASRTLMSVMRFYACRR